MRIIADPNIPYVAEAFSQFGEVELKPGRQLVREDVADCDVLLVRSTVKVNADLLKGTSVRFVGTATSGFDHVDLDYLKPHGIGFAYAPGSNAASVGEYVTSALLQFADLKLCDLSRMSIGIVGYGHVGREVKRCARALGLRCVICDPPLAKQTGKRMFKPLDDILDCDIITLHVPLTFHGSDATYRMVDSEFQSRMKPGALLINAARGEVLDPAALTRRDDPFWGPKYFVVDVWHNEPEIDVITAIGCFRATPHIAGHSFDGKVAGTLMLYEAFCSHQKLLPTWTAEPLLPPPDVPELTINPLDPLAVHEAVRAVYDIMIDHRDLMNTIGLPDLERGEAFDRLRKNYRRRRSFSRTRIRLTEPNSKVEATLRGLGFQLLPTDT